MYNISTYVCPYFTLVAGGTANVDVRLTDIKYMRFGIQQQWNTTSSTTGIGINLYPGFGGKDPAGGTAGVLQYLML